MNKCYEYYKCRHANVMRDNQRYVAMGNFVVETTCLYAFASLTLYFIEKIEHAESGFRL